MYSLVMYFDVKIHCHVCFLKFGYQTALHFCPYCKHKKIKFSDTNDQLFKGQFIYNKNMYHRTNICNWCNNKFKFKLVPFNKKLLSEFESKNKLDELTERQKQDRENRSKDHHQVHGCLNEQAIDIDLLIGECIIEEYCKKCKKEVRNKHKQHILNCYKIKL